VIHLTLVAKSLQSPTTEPADLVIEDQDGYVRGYQQIAAAVHSRTELHVLVKDGTVARWLKVMAKRYGPERISVQELTLHRQFQQQTGVVVPPAVTEQQLLDSELLDLRIPAPPNVSFEDYLLEVFFGNFLTLPGGLRRIGDLVANYNPEQWQAALKRPLVREVYNRRVHQLRQELQAANAVAELQILDWLAISPEELLRNLVALKLLSHYPESLARRVLGKAAPELLKLDLRKVPVMLTSNEKALDEIRLYLSKMADPDHANDLETILNQVSGFLEEEFDIVVSYLTAGKSQVTRETIHTVQEHFKPLATSPRLSQALADLDLLISKTPPLPPDAGWTAQQWIEWATQQYLPYRFWLENTGKLDDQIGDIAGVYADWLYENYGKLLYHSEHMAWKAVLNLKESLKSHKGPVLVVVIDNLNAKFYPEFQTHMQERGFFEHSLAYCFSMLPSCTEVSKKCLITGHYAPFAGTSYQLPVEKTWSERLGRKVKYLSNIGELRLVSKREHDIYFLNYLPLDITLHQSEAQTGLSHAQAIRSYLHSLTQDIYSFSHRMGAERDLMVVIFSDHGSTRIPRGTVNVIQGMFYKNRALDEHHRYLSIADAELAKLPANSRYDCFLFERGLYELEANYLVARRLYRFLPTDENAYIHGGLTPEETLVPVAIYYPVTASPKPLSVNLVSSGKLYVGTKLGLNLELTNYNTYPCESVSIEFPDPNIDAPRQFVGDMAKLQRVSLEVTARCPRTADTTARKLQLRVSYRFLGQPQEHRVEIPVEIIEPARTKFDLDDL
jgi:hypothetical protein